MASSTRSAGEFCWINMLTPQPDRAREFFAQVLEWTFAPIPGIGHRVIVGGRDVGGLFDLDGPGTPPGTLPQIGVMVKVERADATVERVATLGGQAKPAFDIMDQGRMAVCFDPTGAEFDVWEPKRMQGTDVDSSLPGAPSWFELLTADPDRASAFYQALFGWTAEPTPSPGPDYTVFQRRNVPVAGMLRITPEMGEVPPHWSTYFTVSDADEAVRKAVELGAQVCIALKHAAGVGRFCGLISPQGVGFRVIAYDR